LAGSTHGRDKVAVVFVAISKILGIGSVEAVHDPLHAFGTEKQMW
jgi:hypothetical protein